MNYLSSAITLVFILSVSSIVNAQRQEDVIYLNDGSVIRGTIIEDSTGMRIRILNKAGDIWAFSKEKVDSVRQEKAKLHKAFVFNQKGSEISVSVSLLVRSESNAIDKSVIPGLNIAYSYRFFPFLSTGAGLGIEFYEWMVVPVCAFVKLRKAGNAISPYLYFRTGYTLPAEERKDDWDYSYTGNGGIIASAGIGIERVMNENTAFNLSFSYNYQKLNYHLTPLNEWVEERDRTHSFSRLRISLGYVFK